MHREGKRGKPRNHQASREPRPEYIAAVRHLDGRSEIFYIRYADDLDDARELVMAEVGKVQSVVIAQRH
ncbi:hypothetical protein [Dechloromonas sp. HYN0024]|uniref:hypothetical protein n=1 Tax=Dechloromonas sp. HYN0024 TaxID=2231055 RepID=UPI0013C3056F|nr:hypothetical protein [Dechloromonas sp. HYN0024]